MTGARSVRGHALATPAALLHGPRWRDETLLGIDEDIPERAQWIRMLLCELNRMSSHLLYLATNGMDLGAVSMMIYGWREREETLRLLEMITGLRMNHNFIRVGGVAADLPDGWRDATLRVLDLVEPRLDEYDVLMTGQPIWREHFVTDNGNHILDVHNLTITNPLELETRLNQLPGVVTVGIFSHRPADVLLIGETGGVRTMVR